MAAIPIGEGAVFSAHAEVVPHIPPSILLQEGILRARGGSSILALLKDVDVGYSPRTRR